MVTEEAANHGKLLGLPASAWPLELPGQRAQGGCVRAAGQQYLIIIIIIIIIIPVMMMISIGYSPMTKQDTRTWPELCSMPSGKAWPAHITASAMTSIQAPVIH